MGSGRAFLSTPRLLSLGLTAVLVFTFLYHTTTTRSTTTHITDADVQVLNDRIETLTAQLARSEDEKTRVMQHVDKLMKKMSTLITVMGHAKPGNVAVVNKLQQSLNAALQSNEGVDVPAKKVVRGTGHDHPNPKHLPLPEISPELEEKLAAQDALLSSDARVNLTVCNTLRHDYKVQMGRDWGELPKAKQTEWGGLNCDTLLAQEDSIARAKHRLHSLNRPYVSTHIVPVPKPTTNQPVIAICICTTTRRVWDITGLQDLTLFSNLLPSFVKTAEPGFEYWVYVTYDVGDLFYDKDGIETEITTWYNTHVIEPLAKRSITTRLYLLRFDNVEHKPGPAFNFVLATADTDEATYFYRINDDTVLETPWAKAYVNTLQQLGAPYGVVGPTCDEGNTKILTHDFTHRTHFRIFGRETYYPVALSDWWMDDWISRVYGRQRTKRLPQVTVGHSGHHGTRYEIDHSHAALLASELTKGRDIVGKYMSDVLHLEPNVVRAYMTDNFNFKP